MIKEDSAVYYVGSAVNKKEKRCAFCLLELIQTNVGFITECSINEKECTTDNEADLLAAYASILRTYTDKKKKVTIYTTSTYVVNAIGRGWLFSWKENDWKTQQDKDVRFRNVWEKVYKLIYEKGIDVTMKWIRSAEDNPLSEYAFEESGRIAMGC